MNATTVSAADLRQLLRVLVPFADRDGVTTLEAVCLEAAHNNLVGTATNRYVLGHMRILATGDELPATIVPRHAAKVIRRALADARDETVVHLRRVRTLHGPIMLEIDSGDAQVRIRVRTVDATYPKVLHLFEGLDAVPAGLDMPINIDPALTRPFAKAAKTLSLADVRWTFRDPAKPVQVDIGRTFTGLIMPRKFPNSFDRTPVPVGLVKS